MNKIAYKKYLIWLMLVVSAVLLARAGGAGGGSHGGGGHFSGGHGGSHSSGSGDDGAALFYMIYLIFRLLPFPLNIIVLGCIVVGFFYLKRKVQTASVYNHMEGSDISSKSKYQAFIADIPGFDQTQFMGKVENSFYAIQTAWQEQDLGKVRRFISDSVYQRFSVQFKMMHKLEQTNNFSGIEIRNTFIDKAETDGDFDIITVGIEAYINESFQGKFKELNYSGSEVFTEYWVFLKKRNAAGDLYSGNNCPQCGAELPKQMGEISRCEYCNALTNSGEYDWVLAEIIQANDYVVLEKMYRKANLDNSFEEIRAANPDFCAQAIEDKASNAFLQIMVARALNNPAGMRRFLSDTAYEKLSGPNEFTNTIFNRLYINSAAVCSLNSEGEFNKIAVAVKYSSQRVKIEDDKLIQIDYTPVAKLVFLIMSRSKSSSPSKGSLYSRLCPSCGGVVSETTDIYCSYCANPLNSPKFEWIVDEYLSESEYSSYLKNLSQKNPSMAVDDLEGLYDVRDYAFNNLLVVIAADGQFSDEEQNFAAKTAKKFGYDAEKIAPLINLAKSGKLSIYMPNDEKKRAKIIKLMEKGAAIDNNISPEERAILDSLKQS